MLNANEINYDNLDCYILNDQPTTCGLCGSRTDFEEIQHGNRGQITVFSNIRNLIH